MSIASLILANLDSAPFSAAVFPTDGYMKSGQGIKITPSFTVTPSGAGPFTYAWSLNFSMTPTAPAASSTNYSVQTNDYVEDDIFLTCTVTDTLTGQTFPASFAIHLVPPRDRSDLR